MGLRFRKRVTLFPGVRLNFSGGGISTTIGVRGASVNIGPGGTYLNLGLPGSGLSYRARLDGNGSQAPRLEPAVSGPPAPATPAQPFSAPQRLLLPGEGEIRSAAVSALTSKGLGDLKKLINEADARKRSTKIKLEAAEHSRVLAERRLNSARRFIVRLFLWSSIPVRQREVVDLDRMIAEARGELEGSHIDLDFAFDQPTLDAYDTLRRAHARLRASDMIWDVTAAFLTNRVVERTTAATRVDRTPVRLSETASDLLNTRWQGLKFDNANGEDIFVYPGFAMMRERDRDFALVDLREIEIEYSERHFQEEERVPRDAVTIGHTWAKTNKDGSPDRRFRDNYQIPVVRYGRLTIRSRTGINEAYMFSDATAALAFAEAFTAYRRALDALAERSTRSDFVLPRPEADEPTDEESLDAQPTDSTSGNVDGRPPARALLADVLVLVAAVVIGAWAAVGSRAHDPVPIAPIATVALAPSQPTPVLTPTAAEAPVAERVEKPPETPQVREGVVVKAQSANIRTKPDRNAPVASTAKAGTRYSVFTRNGEWLQIGDKEPLGWMNTSVVEAVAR
ncbi:DUF4236 domain-containing protein [Azospirillum argentinense]|uniref:DUF4236 domain-containing protein n=1 Tax=Azospirillum argentinense TaxID=2970906 RepID=UPI00190A73E3|nr:DUF4236 domain-containing protein [Azospirillum argentinense]